MAKAKHDEELTLAISSKDWKKAVRTCEEYEIEHASDNSLAPPNYVLHLLAYLLDGDVINARFLWKRIPAQAKSAVPDLAAVWKIGQAMHKNQPQEVFRAMSSHPFQHGDLIRSLAESYRSHNFILIAKAYTSVPLSTVAELLGLSAQDAQQVCAQAGWGVDAASGNITPVKPPETKDRSVGAKYLQHLTEFFCHLEHGTHVSGTKPDYVRDPPNVLLSVQDSVVVVPFLASAANLSSFCSDEDFIAIILGRHNTSGNGSNVECTSPARGRSSVKGGACAYADCKSEQKDFKQTTCELISEGFS